MNAALMRLARLIGACTRSLGALVVAVTGLITTYLAIEHALTHRLDRFERKVRRDLAQDLEDVIAYCDDLITTELNPELNETSQPTRGNDS